VNLRIIGCLRPVAEPRASVKQTGSEILLPQSGCAHPLLKASERKEAELSEPEVRIEGVGGMILAGTLTLPAGSGPFPAVVAVHGAREGTRDAPCFGTFRRYSRSRGSQPYVSTGGARAPRPVTCSMRASRLSRSTLICG
jgi:hypothetical protein